MSNDDRGLNALKTRLDGGEVSLGMVVRFSRTAEIVAMAQSAGFHSLYVDLEHAPLSASQTSQICIAAQFAGVTPLVRLPAGRLDLVAAVLDGGAMGIIVPHVRSAEEARAAVTAAKFPPFGDRSIAGPPIQLAYRSLPAAETAEIMNRATAVVLMIETADALEAIDEIAAVYGVDMLLVGANDLLGDLGIPGAYDAPELADAFARVTAAAVRNGIQVGVGGLSARLDLAAAFVSAGARYVSVGTDVSFVLRGARQAVEDLQKGLGAR